jgi:large subunit ribosomal protein L13
MTEFVKTRDIKDNWLLVDATDAVVGRLAVFISKTIRGKNKSTFTPHMDHGDFVIIKNVEKIKFTGNKFKNKKYFKHTGYPGGIKETTPERLSVKKPEEILKLAVKRMLPGGPLAKKQMSKLKIYRGDKHPHESQNPKVISLNQMSKKNLLRKR